MNFPLSIFGACTSSCGSIISYYHNNIRNNFYNNNRRNQKPSTSVLANCLSQYFLLLRYVFDSLAHKGLDWRRDIISNQR